MKKNKSDKNFLNKIKESFINSKNEIKDFAKANTAKILPWVSVIFLFSALSLFFTDWTTTDTNDFPAVVYNTLPRALSFLILAAPSFVCRYRKTYFSGAATVWSAWMLIISGVHPFRILLLGIAGIAITAFLFYKERKEEKNVPSGFLISAVKWFYAYTALAFCIELVHRIDFDLFLFNIHKPFVSFLRNPDYISNNILILIACSLFVLLVPKRKLTFSIVSAIWIILAFVSNIKYSNVYEPVLLLDMFEIPEAIAAAKKYISLVMFIFIIIALAALIALIVFLAKKEKKHPFRLTNLITVAAVLAIILCSFSGIRHLSYTNLENKYVRATYFTNGFAYSFFNYAINSVVVEPDGYSTDTVDDITKNVETVYETKGDSSDVQNIIVIQLESFCDPYLFSAAYPDMEIDRDPMPFMRSLMEEYSSGTVNVPVFGGQTVKSEFEFLTGLNMDLLPNGYNPYVQQLCNTGVDSILTRMTELGYTSTAVHTYQGEFFDRWKVYENLGFDTFIPYECMSDVEKRTGKIWADDEILISQINEVLDSTEGKDFVFTVSVQLHGNYLPYEGDYENEISNFDDEELASRLTYYLSELEAFDETIENLIKQLEERNESTYVLFYSDHLPSLFYGVDEMSDDEKFTTQFFTWDNMGLDKQADTHLELYRLSTYMFDTLNIDGGFINKFHTVYSNKSEYMEIFDKLQFYMMFDSEHSDESDKYKKENYSIGLYPVTLDSITPADNDEEYIISGSSLTENVVLSVNGKIYDLEYENENTMILRSYNDGFTSDDLITLRVIGEKYGGVFYETEEYYYNSED